MRTKGRGGLNAVWTREREAGVWDFKGEKTIHCEMRKSKLGVGTLAEPPRNHGVQQAGSAPCLPSAVFIDRNQVELSVLRWTAPFLSSFSV